MLKQKGGVKKIMFFEHEIRKSGLFPCYKQKINDFLSSYNQNLKIDIFTPLQQISCYCKSRLGTLQLISWCRVTFTWQLHLLQPNLFHNEKNIETSLLLHKEHMRWSQEIENDILTAM